MVHHIKVAQFNAHCKSTTDEFEHDLHRLVNQADPDVIMLQEAVGRHRRLDDEKKRVMEALSGYALVRFDAKRPQAQTPILYKTAVWDKLYADSRRMCWGLFMLSGRRCATLFYGRHKASGEVIDFHNSHTVAHVEHNGRPYYLPRLRLYKQHIGHIHGWLEHRNRWGRHGIAAGDYNADYKAVRRTRCDVFPPRAFRHVSRCQWAINHPLPRRGSHGDRFIDDLFVTRRSGIGVTNVEFVRQMYSDHDAVVSTLTF